MGGPCRAPPSQEIRKSGWHVSKCCCNKENWVYERALWTGRKEGHSPMRQQRQVREAVIPNDRCCSKWAARSIIVMDCGNQNKASQDAYWRS